MRRQTTNEPKGPATSARASPASNALSRKSGMVTAVSMDMGLQLAVNSQAAGLALDNAAMQIMGVVMVVVINRQILCVLAKELDKCRVAADLFLVAGAAHMAIQAHHL